MEKKKILSKLLIFIFALALVIPSINILADNDNPRLRLETQTTSEAGDEITIDIYLENIDKIKRWSGLSFDLNYDSEAFTYVGYESSLTGDKFITSIRHDSENNRVRFVSLVQTFVEENGVKYQASDYSGKIGSITFAVTDKANGQYDGTRGLNVVVRDFLSDDGTEDEYGSNNFVDIDIDVQAPETFVEVPVKDITVTPQSMTIVKGEKDKITVSVNPENTTVPKNLSFTSANEKIATVDAEGNVTAVGRDGSNNKTEISVTAYGITKKVEVTVINPIQNIKLNKDSLSLNTKDKKTEQLIATLTPSDTFEDTSIKWESSNTGVATVDGSGVVTALSGGTTIITATASNNMKATASVSVEVPIENVNINKQKVELALKAGQTVTDQLTIDWSPKNTTEDTTISYTSNNPRIATVNNNGLVTAVAPGQTTIVAKLGSHTFNVEVKVTAPLESISLNKDNLSLSIGQSDTLVVSYNPSYTTDDKKVTWTSENDGIARVDENGKVTAVSSGTVKITATVGNKKATATVKVLVPVEGIVILPNSNIELLKGETENLSVKATNADAEEKLGKITWKSSNENVATVDDSGKVTALIGGTTTITATTEDGKSATATVKVNVPLKSISLNKDKETLNKNGQVQLNVIYNPTDTTDNKTVKWTSSDEGVAKVDDSGKVTALSGGTTTITATVGEYTAKCVITVVIKIEKVEINSSDFTLNRGEHKKLNATITPNDTTEDKIVTWDSSNKDVATVDTEGNVIAVSAGKTTITATVGSHTAKVNVTVVVPITNFQASETEMTIYKGATNAQVITTTITPLDTTEDKTIEWTSSDSTTVTVDENGKITGLKVGHATITGKLSNGMNVIVNVTVEIIPVTDLEVKYDDTILKGKTSKITVNPIPANTTEFTNVEFTSSDEEILTVDEDGTVTGLKAGTAKVTIKVGDVEKEIEITIMEVPVKNIVAKSTKNELNVGETTQIEVSINPTTATEELTFTYKSSNEEVAIVDENGLVKGLKAGKVVITVTASNGMEATYEITIKEVKKPSVSPDTSVSTYTSYLILALVSLCLIIFLYLRRSRI